MKIKNSINNNFFPVGINRWVAFIVLKIFFMLILSIWLGLIFFKFDVKLEFTPLPWQIIKIIEAVKDNPPILGKLFFCLLGSITFFAALIFFKILKKYHPDKKILGDAHFASALEIKKAGFFDAEGVIVGKSWGKPLKAAGFEHVLAFAPAGSGKTTSIAIPNLLTWRESCVVNDPKYELFETTSGYRENTLKNKIFCFAPTRRKTHRYNPLQFISKDPFKRIGEIQLIGHVIIPNGAGEPIWTQSSRELFLSLVLYLLDTKDKKATLPEIYNLSKQHHFNEWLTDLIENTDHLDPECYRNISSYLNTAEKTRASIIKTFTGYLEIFANPIINAAVSDSDFDLRNLRSEKITIYIGFSENEKEMISPLLTIFWQQLISFMTEKTPNTATEPYALLCLMEEFSVLGRLVNLKSSLKILRAYRVRVLIIIQYLSQIGEYYSQAETEAFKNIKTKISFALDSIVDAEYVSKILGMQTKRIRNKSATSGLNNSSTSHSDQLQSVPLMRADEILRLKPNQAIIIRTGFAPVFAKQYRWYKEDALKYLPCGQAFIPEQMPMIVPFEKSLQKNKANQHNKEVQDNEIEKLKIQAEFLSGAVLSAINSDHAN